MTRACIICGTPCEGARCPAHPATSRHARKMPAAWTTTRRRIIKRDNGVCQLQLPGCTHVATSADHIIPASKGGDDSDQNLQASCSSCNTSKGARMPRTVRPTA